MATHHKASKFGRDAEGSEWPAPREETNQSDTPADLTPATTSRVIAKLSGQRAQPPENLQVLQSRMLVPVFWGRPPGSPRASAQPEWDARNVHEQQHHRGGVR